MMTGNADYYAILGIPRTADTSMITEAFLKHQEAIPKEQQNKKTNPVYRQLVQAYQVLKNKQTRENYNIQQTPEADYLDIQVQPSTDRLGIVDTEQLVYLLVNIRPPDDNQQSRLPLNLSLVIDRSTSMQGERLTKVKEAVNLIVNQLGPQDRLSIISFSDRATVVLASNLVENKPTIYTKVSTIQANGGTEIFQGLMAGVQELRKTSLNQHINHLIMLTDGHTYGDAPKCLELAQETAQEGIGVSAFGIGSEWNDQFLDQLVTPSGGQSGYIEQPNEIIAFLQERITGLGNVYANNVKMKAELTGEIRLQYGFKLVPFAQPLNLGRHELELGNIEGRSPLSFLLELVVSPQATPKLLKVNLIFEANIPSQNMQEHRFEHYFELVIVPQQPRIQPPDGILQAVQLLSMYRLNERALGEAEEGQLETAAWRMRHLTTRLIEAGHTQLAQHAHAETRRLETMGELSEEGRKRLKYGTRALLTQSLKLDNDDDDEALK